MPETLLAGKPVAAGLPHRAATRETFAEIGQVGATTWSDRQLFDPALIARCQIAEVPCVQPFEKHRAERLPYVIDFLPVLGPGEAIFSVPDLRVLLGPADVTGQFLDGEPEVLESVVAFLLREARTPDEQVVSNRHMIYCRVRTTFGRWLVARQENAPLVMLITVDGRDASLLAAERSTEV